MVFLYKVQRLRRIYNCFCLFDILFVFCFALFIFFVPVFFVSFYFSFLFMFLVHLLRLRLPLSLYFPKVVDRSSLENGSLCRMAKPAYSYSTLPSLHMYYIYATFE